MAGLQRVQRTGSVASDQVGGYRRPALEGEPDGMLARIVEKPDLTRRALVADLAERGGEGGSVRGLVVLPRRRKNAD